MPPHLKACLNQPAPTGHGQGADGLVISQLQANDEKAACYRAVLDWYESVRTATRVARR